MTDETVCRLGAAGQRTQTGGVMTLIWKPAPPMQSSTANEDGIWLQRLDNVTIAVALGSIYSTINDCGSLLRPAPPLPMNAELAASLVGHARFTAHARVSFIMPNSHHPTR